MASQVAGSVASKVVSSLVFGSFNKNYSKDDRRRMRYIQQKYAQAYGSHADDPNTIIHNIDPESKLKMTPDGLKPANPYPDERAFEEALVMNYHPTPGHQGKFCASHALSSIGCIIQYQIERKNRIYVPGVVYHGRANDYVNMFLEEMKAWLKSQLTLDNVSAEELKRRLVYILKIKNDRYYWCFPNENFTDKSIHDVINYCHKKVEDALEITTREEKNKSMQLLFKELNDHTINTFEFGKNFLSYLLYVSKVAGSDLMSSKDYIGKSVESGRLHFMLTKATDSVMKMYVQDMKDTESRLDNNLLTSGTNLPLQSSGNQGTSSNTHRSIEASTSSPYTIENVTYETFKLADTLYSFTISDSTGLKWCITKKYSDFENLHKTIENDFLSKEIGLDDLQLPPKFPPLSFPTNEEQLLRCKQLKEYLLQVFDGAVDAESGSRLVIGDFIEVKTLLVGTSTRHRASEKIPNHFILAKANFEKTLLLITNSSDQNSSNTFDKQLNEFRKQWGHEVVFKVLSAYAHLQRMATILGWTLEINHFFISMFGNTLVFSQLPLKQLLLTQKDVMNSFLSIANELFEDACTLNGQNKYTWHKNLHATESELTRVRHHVGKAVETISTIEREHLDKELQMRRLMDVAARFNPFMTRVEGSLPSIQGELGLPVHSILPSSDSTSASHSHNLRLVEQLVLEGDKYVDDEDTNATAEEKLGSSDRVSEVADTKETKFDSLQELSNKQESFNNNNNSGAMNRSHNTEGGRNNQNTSEVCSIS